MLLDLLQENSYKIALKDTLESQYFKELDTLITGFYGEPDSIHKYFPPKEKIFRALNQLPLNEVKVVILGQDPYHGFGQAEGLAFSSISKPMPPSLKNILVEAERSLKRRLSEATEAGDLSAWVDRGVLLLNSSLTVQCKKPNIHKNYWKKFVSDILYNVAKMPIRQVYMLWGNEAISTAKSILGIVENDENKLVLTTSHPSPLSVYRGFNGCNHFKIAENFLNQKIFI